MTPLAIALASLTTATAAYATALHARRLVRRGRRDGDAWAVRRGRRLASAMIPVEIASIAAAVVAISLSAS